jgi:hypothetical protein
MMRYTIVGLFVVLLASPCVGGADPVLEGDYLGQTPPGRTAELFAPGVVSVEGRYEYGVAWSPDGNELFFTGEVEGEAGDIPTGLLVLRRNDGAWTDPEVADLRREGKWEQEAFYTVDGQQLYFCSPVEEGEHKLWFCDREGDGWSKATLLDSPVNEPRIVFYATFTKDGTMYYTNVIERKIYVSPLVDGAYPSAAPAKLAFGGHPFVAPGGDFLLVDGKRDIWVAFPGEEGVWSEPVRLDQCSSSEFGETCPSLTPDGKYIFFARYNEPGEVSNIYWVSSAIIEDRRPGAGE